MVAACAESVVAQRIVPQERGSVVRVMGKSRDFIRIALKWNQTRLDWIMAIVIAVTAGYLDGYGLFFLKTLRLVYEREHQEHWLE